MAEDVAPPDSARRDEVLELAYRYVLERGITGLSLRPLAAAVGSSPRVLLFLFGSKEGLVHALLARARADELELVERLRASSDAGRLGLAQVMVGVWRWLAAEEHRPLLRLWAEGYGQSLVDPDGPWAGFAEATVDDWLALLASAQHRAARKSRAGATERTVALAILRGALLDLLATDDVRRTTAAVDRAASLIGQ